MPITYFPEGTVPLAQDSELRSLHKACSELYDSVGNRPSPYPEGCLPLAQDNEERLWKKINILEGGI